MPNAALLFLRARRVLERWEAAPPSMPPSPPLPPGATPSRTRDTRGHARHLTPSELEDHTPTFLAEVAQVMVVLEEDGADAQAIPQGGQEFRTLMAVRHAQQRRRLGFTEAALAREYEILHEEMESAPRQAHLAGSEGPTGEAREMVRKLLAQAAEQALRTYRSASAGE